MSKTTVSRPANDVPAVIRDGAYLTLAAVTKADESRRFHVIRRPKNPDEAPVRYSGYSMTLRETKTYLSKFPYQPGFEVLATEELPHAVARTNAEGVTEFYAGVKFGNASGEYYRLFSTDEAKAVRFGPRHALNFAAGLTGVESGTFTTREVA